MEIFGCNYKSVIYGSVKFYGMGKTAFSYHSFTTRNLRRKKVLPYSSQKSKTDQNRSNKMFESRTNSADADEIDHLQARDNGDGSSRQDSLSRQDDDVSPATFLASLKSATNTPPSAQTVRELQAKVHEYKIICQVCS